MFGESFIQTRAELMAKLDSSLNSAGSRKHDADIGQGSDTVLSQAAAEAMGITMDHMSVLSADSDLTPIGFGAYSSRVTLMGGNASKMAGEEVKKQVLVAASEILNIDVEKLDAKNNKVFEISDPDNYIEWSKAAAAHFSVKGPNGYAAGAGRPGALPTHVWPPTGTRQRTTNARRRFFSGIERSI